MRQTEATIAEIGPEPAAPGGPDVEPAGPSAPPKVRVSVLVPVKNEAENLRRCLPALAWADEVFVVDSQSSDGTAAVAAEHGARVVPVPLQRRLSQEEELGPGEPPVPQRMGPDRRRR